jgi:hypothetical protein
MDRSFAFRGKKISATLRFLLIAAAAGAIAPIHIGEYRGYNKGAPVYHPKRKKYKPARFSHGKKRA